MSTLELNKGENGRVKVGDKRLINAVSDVNQLVPFKYRWAWEMYNTNSNNHWMPQETNLINDKAYFVKESPQVVKAIKLALATVVLNHTYSKGDISQAIYRIMTAPECRQFMLRQLFEESLDVHVVSHVCKEFDIDIEEIIDLSYQASEYNDRYAKYMAFTSSSDFVTDTEKGIVEFFKLFTAVNIGAKVVRGHAAYVYMTEYLPAHYKGLHELFKRLLATNISHADFAVEFINSMKYENPVCSNQAIGVYLLSELKELAAMEAERFVEYSALNHQTAFREYLNYRVLSYCKKTGFYNQPAHLVNPIPGTDDLPGVKSHQVADTPVAAVNNGLDWD